MTPLYRLIDSVRPGPRLLAVLIVLALSPVVVCASDVGWAEILSNYANGKSNYSDSFALACNQIIGSQSSNAAVVVAILEKQFKKYDGQMIAKEFEVKNWNWPTSFFSGFQPNDVQALKDAMAAVTSDPAKKLIVDQAGDLTTDGIADRLNNIVRGASLALDPSFAGIAIPTVPAQCPSGVALWYSNHFCLAKALRLSQPTPLPFIVETSKVWMLNDLTVSSNHWLLLDRVNPGSSQIGTYSQIVEQLRLRCSVTELGFVAQPPITLGTPFADNMVLQQGKPNHIWGWGPQKVNIRVLSNGEELANASSHHVGNCGVWDCEFKIDGTSYPQNLEIRIADSISAKNLTGVSVGDVYLLAGDPEIAGISIKGSDTDNNIRFLVMNPAELNVPTILGSTTAKTWVSPKEFAVPGNALAIARKLTPNPPHPIGIIVASMGAADLPAWTPPGDFDQIASSSPNPYPAGQWFSDADHSMPDSVVIAPSELYNGMLSSIGFGDVQVTLAGAVFSHGEWLASQNDSLPAEYSHNLANLIAGWRRTLVPALVPIVIVQSHLLESLESGTLPSKVWSDLQTAQLQMANSPNVIVARTAGLRSGGIHFRREDKDALDSFAAKIAASLGQPAP